MEQNIEPKKTNSCTISFFNCITFFQFIVFIVYTLLIFYIYSIIGFWHQHLYEIYKENVDNGKMNITFFVKQQDGWTIFDYEDIISVKYMSNTVSRI